MKDLINDPAFYKTTGTIFMELSADKQDTMNQFFDNKELNPEIILNIFREMQLDGWYDRGSYEFLISLWKLNKTLSEKEKIKVILADVPMPLSCLETSEDYRKFSDNKKDRNEQMVDVIEQTVKTSSDTRHNLFIVGEGHAYKSSTIVNEGEGGSRHPDILPKHSAGYQLVERFSDEDVFCIISHSPMMSNSGSIYGKIRGGMYDYAFSCMGNKPLAFNLKNSPFGKEVFDALPGIAFKEETGSFENNYDGYVFLQPLEKEEANYLLYEVITDDFVNELKRRAVISNTEKEKWFGVENKNLTKEAIILYFENINKRNKRWEDL
jgi:hypothetical protein